MSKGHRFALCLKAERKEGGRPTPLELEYWQIERL